MQGSMEVIPEEMCEESCPESIKNLGYLSENI